MQDNDAYRSVKNTSEYLQHIGFSGPPLKKQPVCSSDSNPIVNIWSISNRQVYRDGRQIFSEYALLEAILDAPRDPLCSLEIVIHQPIWPNFQCVMHIMR